MKLAKIEEVKPRKVWANEATDFTPWLALDENLELLGQTLGLELEMVSTEEKMNGGRADLLCKETGTDRNVIIENQLEKTDPDHLGRILSYASALDAKTIIWIATEFDEQYRSTLDWLNRATDEDFKFFGIEIHLLKIGDSDPAPQFKIIVSPNGWQKQTRATQKVELSDKKIAQQQYWQGFNEYMQKHPSKLFKAQKGLPQHWTNVALGKSGVYLSLQVNSVKKVIGAVLIITLKDYFDQLAQHKDSFQEIMPQNVVWERMNDKKESHVSVFVPFDFENVAQRQEQYQWLRETTEQFAQFFKPKIKELK